MGVALPFCSWPQVRSLKKLKPVFVWWPDWDLPWWSTKKKKTCSSALYSISLTNKCLQKINKRQKSIIFTDSNCNGHVPATLLNRKILKHTHYFRGEWVWYLQTNTDEHSYLILTQTLKSRLNHYPHIIDNCITKSNTHNTTDIYVTTVQNQHKSLLNTTAKPQLHYLETSDTAHQVMWECESVNNKTERSLQ